MSHVVSCVSQHDQLSVQLVVVLLLVFLPALHLISNFVRIILNLFFKMVGYFAIFIYLLVEG